MFEDPDIQKALEDYRDIIDSNKSGPSLSQYKVKKPWGYEIWLDMNPFYVFKLIHMKKGFKSSLQLHKKKIEANFVIKGKAKVLIQNGFGMEMEEKIIEAGSGWCVPVGKKHRVTAITSYTALEVSTPHLDDVVRLEDDNDRRDGKVRGEHTKKL